MSSPAAPTQPPDASTPRRPTHSHHACNSMRGESAERNIRSCEDAPDSLHIRTSESSMRAKHARQAAESRSGPKKECPGIRTRQVAGGSPRCYERPPAPLPPTRQFVELSGPSLREVGRGRGGGRGGEKSVVACSTPVWRRLREIKYGTDSDAGGSVGYAGIKDKTQRSR
ncbi:hypothetical protein E2C01_101037 [Portunus trituberculatus]|uniref:Uncharacterized protein n=1 Tax=Portunus trituberculatus TaxID=210409 RepID=A0A5B7K4N4_PORTR|nr:hypothetical protein [Portunus trituberculatus]